MATIRDYDASPVTLRDSLGRTITYARISLTDRCNFRCVYCVPRGETPFVARDRLLSYEEILRLAGVFGSLGISSFKVTGGEPLCREGAAGFIAALTRTPGVAEVTLTTNGFFAADNLAALAACGVRSITFSCDAFGEAAFRRITRTDVRAGAVLDGMEQAAALGLRVKINMVPVSGYNDGEILPLARHALERGYHIRFIELMPVGSGSQLRGIPLGGIRAALEREFGPLDRVRRRTGNGPAKMYSIAGYSGYVGFIAAMSDRFCRSCNRVRLTSTGFLKTCLCHDAGVDLRRAMAQGVDDAVLRRLIREAVAVKPEGHVFPLGSLAADTFSMRAVGG